MSELRYLRPRTVKAACVLLREHGGGSAVLGGGTAFVLMLRQGLIRPNVIVSLQDVVSDGRQQWSGVAAGRRVTRVGAGTTLADLAASPHVRLRHPSLAAAASLVGNPRIRNVATIGGNLAEADYASDPPSVLVSLGARCVLRSATGTRELSVSDLLTGPYQTALRPDENITAILVPRPRRGERSVYARYAARSSEDRPAISVATTGVVRDGIVKQLRVVVGAVEAKPRQFPDIVRTIRGRRLDQAAIEAVAAGYAERVSPIEDQRGTAGYRRQLVRTYVARSLRALATGEGKVLR